MRTTCALCLLLLMTSVPAGAQTPPQTFRADVDAVEIDVRVLDERGRQVTGLTAADFELFEDGVRQDIRLVTPVTVPFLAPSRTGRLVPRDTSSNAEPFTGRVYAIVLDDLHTHPLRGNRVKAVVRQFVERHLGRNDRAAVVVTSGRGVAMQELTADPHAILRAVDGFIGQKMRGAVFDRIDEYYRLRNVRELETTENQNSRDLRINDPNEMERAHQARRALTSLRDVARWLESVPAQRKALLFVSEGNEYDLSNLVENRFAGGLLGDLQEAVAGAARSRTSIYAIDPRGLGGLEDELAELSSLPDETTNLGRGAIADALRVTQDNLRILAEQTGGFALVNTNDLPGGFERLVRDNSEFYLIGYEPRNTRRDGRFRRVEVKVKQPGLRVVARRGYYARDERRPAPRTAPGASPLKALLDSPVPVQGLPITSHVAVFRGAGEKGSTLITVEVGPGVNLRQDGDIHKGRVDIAVIAIDQQGKVAATDDRGVALNLKPTTRAVVERHGMRITKRLELKPGRYQLRVAAYDPASGKGGSVLHDVEVPEFEDAQLAMSDLVTVSTGAVRTMTANVDAELRTAVTFPPTAVRTFARSEDLGVFAEIYDNRKRGQTPVLIRTTVSDDAGRVAWRSEEKIDAAEFDTPARRYRHRAQVPLRPLAAGQYVLAVTVEPSGGEAAPLLRELAFAIRDDEPATATN